MIASVTEAKRKLLEFARLASVGKTVMLTRRGTPYVVMMSAAEYESIQETLDILSDPEALSSLAKSKEDIQTGRLVSWKDVKNPY
ncbi:type II toxin-antitoxin system Phd/YefM family antitoxin [Candidatus Poribacteria bacterium]|nr:type II toxin-antitoxin system Phd/YefM family antitoxin [Candidatus Poribacteria bacterium]